MTCHSFVRLAGRWIMIDAGNGDTRAGEMNRLNIAAQSDGAVGKIIDLAQSGLQQVRITAENPYRSHDELR